MKNNAVQFRGIRQVKRAYEANDIAAWSMWQGPDLLFKYPTKPCDDDELSMDEGGDLIGQAMEMLKEGGSEANYTLRVYSRLNGKDIDSKTPYSNSFKFGLFDFNEEQSPYQHRATQTIGALQKRMDEMQGQILDKLMAHLDGDDEEEPAKVGGVEGFLGSLLDNPQVQQMIMQKVSQWVNGFMAPAQPAAVAGIESGVETGTPVKGALSDDQIQKVNDAIQILAQCDPKLGDNLMKVAAIARDSPMKYKSFTFML
mgnify:CR=1 FL=1